MAPENAASQARENVRAPGSFAFLFTPDWLRKRRVCADWLQYSDIMV